MAPPSLKLPSSLWQASPRQAAVASCPWRIEYEGALYHVFSRGNNHQGNFITDDDRYLSSDTAGQMSERFEIDIFTNVLMDNHYRLLLRTPKANLSRSMQWLGIRKKLALEPKFQKRIAALKSQITP
jgi:REP element-mobilizing transposase RayT